MKQEPIPQQEPYDHRKKKAETKDKPAEPPPAAA